jgi:hypothetical protein
VLCYVGKDDDDDENASTKRIRIAKMNTVQKTLMKDAIKLINFFLFHSHFSFVNLTARF